MEIISIVIFAAALSLDGMAAGMAYGVRRVKIPLLSLLVISLASATCMGIAMMAGHLIAQILSPAVAKTLGASLLVLVGLWVIKQTWSQGSQTDFSEKKDPVNLSEQESEGDQEIASIRIPIMGLVVQIIKEPHKADLDNSGVISKGEALLLGIALAMDALGAGVGAAMAGFKPLLTPLIVGVVKFTLVSLGLYLGRHLSASRLGHRLAVLSGWFLVFIGLSQIYRG